MFSFFISLSVFGASMDADVEAVKEKLIQWRRDIHQNPELGEQEVRTSELIAKHLKSLGMEVKTGIAKTGVVGILRGSAKGPKIALRADMDALPVKEDTKLPFASKAKGNYLGQKVDVMHACGHDAHVAILMATAEILAKRNSQNKLPGTVMFIFQPAEEGPSLETEKDRKTPWGAQAMLKEDIFRPMKPDAVLGLHVSSEYETGQLAFRSGAAMASYDDFFIDIKGKQAHAALPWTGVDALLAGARVVESLNTVVSRRLNISDLPAVVTVGYFRSGNRTNVISETAELGGTIRTFSEPIRKEAIKYVREAAEASAKTVGARAEVHIVNGYGVTTNDSKLTERMAPILSAAANGNTKTMNKINGSEDFSFFSNEAPGLFVFLGVTPKSQVGKTHSNHSNLFTIDEKALPVGVKAMTLMTMEFLGAKI